MNCTLCHDWSGVNEASMIRVDSNCRTYIIYTLHRFWMGGYLRSEYYTFCEKKFLLVFTSSDETSSSKFIRTLGTPVTYKSRLLAATQMTLGLLELRSAKFTGTPTYMTLTTRTLGSSLRAHFWMGGYFRSEYYTLFGEEFLLVFASGDETCSSMVIQVHQDIGDTGYIQIQVTQYTYIITRQNTE